MNITANEYAVELEKYHLNNAQHLIDTINGYIKDDKREVMVDIGCGSGKLLSVISEALAFNTVIGIDIDPNMIGFANANKLTDRIEFLTQDIDMDWNEMRPELKALESRVSLVFSNFTFQWIKNKDNAVNNIFRLLANGGKFYALVMVVPNPLQDLMADKEISEFIKIKSKQEQFSEWLDALTDNGLIVDKTDLIDSHYALRRVVYDNILQKMLLKLISNYVRMDSETEREEFTSKHADSLKRGHDISYTKQNIDQQTGEEFVDLYLSCIITLSAKKL